MRIFVGLHKPIVHLNHMRIFVGIHKPTVHLDHTRIVIGLHNPTVHLNHMRIFVGLHKPTASPPQSDEDICRITQVYCLAITYKIGEWLLML